MTANKIQTLTLDEVKEIVGPKAGSKYLPRFDKAFTPGLRSDESSRINIYLRGSADGAELAEGVAFTDGALVVDIEAGVDRMIAEGAFKAFELPGGETVRLSVAKKGGARQQVVDHYVLMQRISYAGAANRAGVPATVNAVGNVLVVAPKADSRAAQIAAKAGLAA